MTALYYAAKSSRTSIVKLLLERGADAYLGDENRCTALGLAEFVKQSRGRGF